MAEQKKKRMTEMLYNPVQPSPVFLMQMEIFHRSTMLKVFFFIIS